MKLYRARDGKFLGVCLGIARSMDWPVRLVRLGFILATVFTGFWPGIAVYLVAGLVLEPEPVLPPQSQGESDFYARYRSSRKSTMAELHSRIKALDQRVRRMEDKITRPGFDWDARMKY